MSINYLASMAMVSTLMRRTSKSTYENLLIDLRGIYENIVTVMDATNDARLDDATINLNSIETCRCRYDSQSEIVTDITHRWQLSGFSDTILPEVKLALRNFTITCNEIIVMLDEVMSIQKNQSRDDIVTATYSSLNVLCDEIYNAVNQSMVSANAMIEEL